MKRRILSLNRIYLPIFCQSKDWPNVLITFANLCIEILMHHFLWKSWISVCDNSAQQSILDKIANFSQVQFYFYSWQICLIFRIKNSVIPNWSLNFQKKLTNKLRTCSQSSFKNQLYLLRESNRQLMSKKDL